MTYVLTTRYIDVVVTWVIALHMYVELVFPVSLVFANLTNDDLLLLVHFTVFI